jgi:N-methylhydantoinase B/oxoprolinase/acetone carboxylase alpha subunit
VLEAEDWMDDGTRIKLRVEVDGRRGTAHFDFAGTGAEVLGNCNAPRAVTFSAIIYALRCMVARDIPLNQGCLNPVRVSIPEGSILSPSPDAAVVGGNVLTSQAPSSRKTLSPRHSNAAPPPARPPGVACCARVTRSSACAACGRRRSPRLLRLRRLAGTPRRRTRPARARRAPGPCFVWRSVLGPLLSWRCTRPRGVAVLRCNPSLLNPQRLQRLSFSPNGSQGCMNNVTFGDDSFGYYETIAGGAGAGPGWHGRSGVHTHMTNTRITDVEILERRFPILVRHPRTEAGPKSLGNPPYEPPRDSPRGGRRRARQRSSAQAAAPDWPLQVREFGLRRGSGGPGEFRGGDGTVRELEMRRALQLSVLTERRARAPFGLAGGCDAAVGANLLVRAGGRVVSLGGKNSVCGEAGDRLRLLSPGGGCLPRPFRAPSAPIPRP